MMILIHPQSRRSTVTHPAILGVCLIMLNGCGPDKVAGPRTDSPTALSIKDFRSPDGVAENPNTMQNPAEPVETMTDSSLTPSSSNDSDRASGDAVTLTRPGQPRPVEIESPQITPDRASTGSLQLLDAKIGDVNGKPIFTSSFFAPIEDRLMAEADRLPLNEWRGAAGRIIATRLDGIIADELLRAEALAALTPTQRVGLQAFLSNFRNNLLSENLGSSQLANRRIQESQGITLDEALKQKEVDTLVQLTLIREINRRVNVSWRDIKQRYERDIDEFSPPPTAVLRVIRAFKDDADTVDNIETALAQGEDFVKVAAGPLNNYNTDSDGMHRVLIEDQYETTEFFGPEVLNEATRKLEIGQQAGPIELGSSVYWIKLMDLEQESVSLYDAQYAIQRDLTYERREEAKQQYFERLQERARVSTRDEVLMRLFEIADRRYAPNQ